jgi:hypothetical protein
MHGGARILFSFWQYFDRNFKSAARTPARAVPQRNELRDFDGILPSPESQLTLSN